MKTKFNKAFWKWFGDSKVVDESGQPLVVYHGTNADFDVFKLDKFGKNTGENYNTKIGFYFTPDYNLATDFTRDFWTNSLSKLKKKASIMPCYLSIQNPRIITAFQFTMGFFRTWKREDLIRAGYDGVIITPFTPDEKNRWDSIFSTPERSGSKEFDYNQYIVFSPNQIKSATGNDGTWDIDDDSVLSGTEDLTNTYMLLNRLMSDCDYFLGHGNRAESRILFEV